MRASSLKPGPRSGRKCATAGPMGANEDHETSEMEPADSGCLSLLTRL
jgi:hypothetical protein